MENTEFIPEEVAIRDHLIRKNHAMPDVEKELSAFMQNNEVHQKKGKRVVLWTADAVVAAVAVVVFMTWQGYWRTIDNNQGRVVAYEADATIGKEITLQCGDDEPQVVSLNALASLTRVTSPNKNDKEEAEENTSAKKYSLRTPTSMMAQMTLSDGTKVWLNAASCLVYPERFSGRERRVEVSGEAYFDVAKDAGCPFVVVAGGSETKVLGTEFNVRARKGRGVHVTLVEGSVDLTSMGETIRLPPGEDALVADGKQIAITTPDMEIYTAWRNGQFYFDNMTIADIATEIGMWYNVSVIFNAPEKMHTRLFFAADRNSELGGILQLLNSIGKAHFTLEDNQIVID